MKFLLLRLKGLFLKSLRYLMPSALRDLQCGEVLRPAGRVPIEAAKIQPMGKGRSQPERQGKGVGRCGTVLVEAAAVGWIRRWESKGGFWPLDRHSSPVPRKGLFSGMRMIDGKWNGEYRLDSTDGRGYAMAAILRK